MSTAATRELLVRDVSRAGHELGRRLLTDVPGRLTVRELLARRVRADVEDYNAEVGPVYRGLVQPADSIRHSDGFRMQRPRRLDAGVFVAAAEEAVEADLLAVRQGDRQLTDLDATMELDEHDDVALVLERPVVVRS